MSTRYSLAASARHYIEDHRLELVPLIPGTKKPLFKTGSNHAGRAVSTIDEIPRWWSNGKSGIALSGRRNRLAAFDVDGREGFEKWRKLETVHGMLPITWGLTSNRPGGDRVAFIYSWPAGCDVFTNNKVDGCKKLELKAGSSIFVLPPSTHPFGTTYSWLNGVSCCEIELTALPEWVAAIGGAQ